ncbi:MAG: metallophosphoesterase [Spirochaetales bacterium]|nr:metallophosphoesterase [Spirochaetales bacterium]
MIIFIFFSCSTEKTGDSSEPVSPLYPECRFFVISDLHYLSPLLYDGGEAFNNHLMWKKGGLTEYGDEILQSFGERADGEKPDFILIPGDLTNNGEKQSHLDLAQYFTDWEERGTEVYVIPGNHDIDFPYPLAFTGPNSYRTESLSAGEFLNLYGDFGYEEACSRDRWSLSYAACPLPGLTLIGLDSCVYGQGYGSIKEETLRWLGGELNRAAGRKDGVILFMHHSLLEHYRGQQKEKGMRLENSKDLLALLSQYEVSLVFTGHYHAQDIVSERIGERNIYDIQTGSLISWPFAYRQITCENSTISLRSQFLEIPALQGKGWNLSYRSIYRFSDTFLKRYGVDSEDRDKISDYAARVLLNHYQGDEEKSPSPEPPRGLSLWGKLALRAGRSYYQGRLSDPEPEDLNIEIDPVSGEWTALP